MNKEEVKKIIEDITNKELDVSNVIISLSKLGYIPTKSKEFKLQWLVILSSAFKNIFIFDEDKISKFIDCYMKISRI